ncbi:hypothetical protein EV363DRAFT_1085545, partial [Boletus edulis]
NGQMSMRAFDKDQFAHIRQFKNFYYLFADCVEWDMVEFLLTSSLSMADIDHFFSLLMIQGLGLSFQTASRLYSLTEILPKTSPWKCHVIDTSPHQTKSPTRLFYCDTMECLEMLLSTLLFGNSIDFSSYHMFT